MDKFGYIAILSIFLISGLILQKRFKLVLFSNFKEVVYYYGFMLILGVIWDNYAVWQGYWNYPGKGILGVFIGLIPLENYFFGVICAYFLLIIYKLITRKS